VGTKATEQGVPGAAALAGRADAPAQSTKGEMPMTSDEVLLINQRVRISRHKVVIGPAAYPVDSILGVQKSSAPPDRRRAFWLVGLGALLLLTACLALSGSEFGTQFIGGIFVVFGPTALVVGLASTAGGLWLARQATQTYAVSFSTRAGETRVISSPDAAEIETIFQALSLARAAPA
jgi:hypothetical protein